MYRSRLLATFGFGGLLVAATGCVRPHPGLRDADGPDVLDPYDAAPAPNPEPDFVFPPPPDVTTTADAASACDLPNLNSLDYWFYRGSNIGLFSADLTDFGLGPDVPYSITLIRADQTYVPQPEDTTMNCHYFTVGRTGDETRNNAPSPNFGTITFTAQGQTIPLLFDTSVHQYIADFSMVNVLPEDTVYQVHFEGGPDGPPGTTMVRMPPRLRHDMVRLPPFSRVTNGRNVVTWDLPMNMHDDDVMVIFTVNSQRAQNGMCAVPACRHSATLPAQFFTHFNPGQTMGVLTFLISHVEMFTEAGIPIKFQVGSGPLYLFPAPSD